MKVVIAGGGTAGHVYPAIAVARALTDAEVLFLGTRSGSESTLVSAAGYRMETVEVRGFDRSKPWSIVSTGAIAVRAVGSARRVLKSRDPDVVLGMGGYVSLPACMAARSMHIPVALHEQNIVLGLANKACKPLARRVAVSFEETLSQAGKNGVLTGNPVRPELVGADLKAIRARAVDDFGLDTHRKTLLVFGGSQGARSINEAVAGLAAQWATSDDRQILHITGPAHASAIRARVSDAGKLLYRVVEYVDDMSTAYAVADLALCRGGATTVAELGVTGVPSIIVPYPYHRDRQQERHGRALERVGAAVVVDDASMTTTTLASIAGELLEDDAKLDEMRTAAKEFGRPDAAERVATLLKEVAR
jgi:UDP-N-acetylglucosamine--N-acetylmuramyl-(pentapeptide) pyrophosphoryl-undecaprenol N-acetylglucosamine transferase